MNKYHAHPTKGHASKKEAQRADELEALEQQGRIRDLQEQVPFLLIPKQKRADGTTERAVKYIADFVYTNSDDITIVEDTKGMRTKDYIIKRKLMLYIHGITITEI